MDLIPKTSLVELSRADFSAFCIVETKSSAVSLNFEFRIADKKQGTLSVPIGTAAINRVK